MTRRTVYRLLPPVAVASSWAFFKFSLANSKSRLSWICFFSNSANLAPSSQDFCNQQQDASIDKNKIYYFQVIKCQVKIPKSSKTTVESNIQQQSRGLHQVGALRVPPPVHFPLDMVSPARV